MSLTKEIVKFQDKKLPIIVVNGRPAMTADVIAKALGYEHRDRVRRLFNLHRDEFEEGTDYFRVKLTQNQGRPENIYARPGTILLCMFSNQPLAKEFRRWAKHALAERMREPISTHAPEPLLPSPEPTVEIKVSEYNELLKAQVKYLKTENADLKEKVVDARTRLINLSLAETVRTFHKSLRKPRAQKSPPRDERNADLWRNVPDENAEAKPN